MEFLETMTGEVTAGPYLLSIAEIKKIVQQIVTGAPLIVNNYILGLIWGNDLTKYLFHSHSKEHSSN